MRLTERIKVLTFAAKQVEQMHGSVTDEDHNGTADLCDCEYGITLRGLGQMLSESRNFQASLERQKRGTQLSPLAAR